MVDAVRVDGLTKRYGELTAVAGIQLTVPQGRVFAFLGPNGAGKTTTVEILEGLRKKSSGTVEVLGLDPWVEGRSLHERIGVIPQDFRFLEKITPAEAVVYYGRLFGKRPDVAGLLEKVELTEKADARFDTLSGGQKQKLGLALALVNEPEVCFLDEPTTGLDPHARRAIQQVIRSLKADGRTVFLTTHYLEEAEMLADQVAIIHQGRIIAEGTPESIIRAHGRPERLVIEAGPALADRLRSEIDLPIRAHDRRVEVDFREKGDIVRVLIAIERSGIPWSGFATQEDTLEDVFVALVGRMDEGVLKSEASA
ncbi:MAG TPA: ABC transporter ATP-binding protein [Thermoplasmata archaeon]|nr:ABC transporter ATP-binding protein [Thermoplasmata archaeon]